MTTVFVLKKRSPQSWSLKTKGLMIDKSGYGLKHAGYFPGQESIFLDEVYAKNKDLKPTAPPDFEFNKDTNRTELTVNNSNKNLIEFLTKHPWYGKRYEIFSEEIESEKALASFDKMEKAFELLKEEDSNKIKAMAMVVFGVDAFGWVESLAKAKLKQLAMEKPQRILDKLQSKDYEAHYIASMAYVLGIVKNNVGHSAVVWKDNERPILSVSKGENGNEKLGYYLSEKTEESTATLQEISNRINGVYNVSTSEVNHSGIVNKLAEKDLEIDKRDSEIERLKAALATAESKKGSEEPPVSGGLEEVTDTGGTELSLDEIHALYKEKTGNEVPNNMKNNRQWLFDKINE